MVSCRTLPGHSVIDWDPALSASDYATFSALLGGFAISGLLWLASLNTDKTPARTQALALIAGSLAPLTLATLAYAEASGTTDCLFSNIEIALGNLLLSMGGVVLLLGVGTAIAGYFDSDLDVIAQALPLAAIVVATVGLGSGNYVAMTLANGSDWWSSGPEGGLQLAVLLASIVAGYLLRGSERLHDVKMLSLMTIALSTAIYLLVLTVALGAGSVELTRFVTWLRLATWFIVLPPYVASVSSLARQSAPLAARKTPRA